MPWGLNADARGGGPTKRFLCGRAIGYYEHMLIINIMNSNQKVKRFPTLEGADAVAGATE